MKVKLLFLPRCDGHFYIYMAHANTPGGRSNSPFYERGVCSRLISCTAVILHFIRRLSPFGRRRTDAPLNRRISPRIMADDKYCFAAWNIVCLQKWKWLDLVQLSRYMKQYRLLDRAIIKYRILQTFLCNERFWSKLLIASDGLYCNWKK